MRTLSSSFVNRQGMTLVEVLAMLLLVSLGMASVIGLVRWGLKLSDDAIARQTAQATAMSLFYDPNPLTAAGSAVLVTPDSYDLTDTLPTADRTSTGVLNGLYVRRTEGSQTLVAKDIVQAVVKVEVYAGQTGGRLAVFQGTVQRSLEP
jgi:hypothetical protein